MTFDFILKPVSFENFSKVLHKACDFLCMAKVNFVLVIVKTATVSLPIHCIYRKTWKKSPYTHQYRDIYQCNKNLDEIWSQLDKRMFASIQWPVL